MPVGVNVTEDDLVPIVTESGAVEVVDQFRYLGCLITPDASCSVDVASRLAAASRAFCKLRTAVFCNRDYVSGNETSCV